MPSSSLHFTPLLSAYTKEKVTRWPTLDHQGEVGQIRIQLVLFTILLVLTNLASWTWWWNCLMSFKAKRLVWSLLYLTPVPCKVQIWSSLLKDVLASFRKLSQLSKCVLVITTFTVVAQVIIMILGIEDNAKKAVKLVDPGISHRKMRALDTCDLSRFWLIRW